MAENKSIEVTPEKIEEAIVLLAGHFDIREAMARDLIGRIVAIFLDHSETSDA